ncbi:bifunctional glutamate N-acetyltransferase/amino-acid acetyltransferase ArgJ [Granulicoccus phenolivorans]|uniref:bifunctional glutamate N-acetyltransferase/amino-acid acetyltransferase ArgJ n=1 Tax=Granulicoccus phenolivorans TaxID=266854 RepID=UPI00040C06D7|nr:bifunctional glutamate N-acetyltransferase/amino-acid acetyltransferase ArgJ [Granulicoccus phenolivorans]
MSESEWTFPSGFTARVAALGLRETGDDLSLVLADRPAACAAMFTRSLFAGPSVTLSKHRAAAGTARGIVTVAKNANVATGAEGARNAAEVADLAATAYGLPEGSLLICSTGVIGRQYPMPVFRDHFAAAAEHSRAATPLAVATAMMTTDTHPKLAQAYAGPARVLGIAKGVGMSEPNMATVLVYLFTDAEIAAPELDALFRPAVEDTLNSLSVDTDTSTSDTAIILASGAAGPVEHTALADAVGSVLLDLTRQLARDGEGATKLLTVTVTGARDKAQAKRAAKAVVNSPLVKTAVHGADPNWGRVAMAIGKLFDDTDIDPERVSIAFGDQQVYPIAADGQQDLARLTEIMRAEEVVISVDLGITDPAGEARSTVYGCDLTDQYVRINADYTT